MDSLVLLAIVGGIYIGLNGLPQKKNEIANEVLTYLTTDRLFRKGDIKEIEGLYSFKSGDYQANVIYADEPNINYTYEKVKGRFKLAGTSDVRGKHMDETFDQ
ncbi:DUF3139 domain-containing protein [Paenibacillus tengchongensis]|uniref:DUF3139 domain-containing protein n=1 Tax=Paenibacillus tengchongensis TaxID=2608684 RepID=UPI001651F486|nr:DUF3139 domain-containing protein [Paenibacillus tengchongensis]